MGRTKVGRTRRLAVNRVGGRFIAGRLGLCVVGTLLALPGIASAATVKADFNGDGRSDLAVGVPSEDIGSIRNAGAVNVIYGSASGATSAGNQFFSQDTSGIEDTAEEFDRFGSALAAGDFNGDDRADLAVGVDFEDVGSTVDAGAVNVIYGSADGLTSAGDQFFHQNTSGIEDMAEEFDIFGSALAAGDFNGDGLEDLAVGVPGEDIGSVNAAGAVSVIYASADGLATAGDQFFSQDTSGIGDKAEASDRFGWALAAANFNKARADLAVGIPGEDIGSVNAAGAVLAIYGSADGLTSVRNQFLTQKTSGVADTVEEGDRFGDALAAGGFNSDRPVDLAIGVPSEDIGSAPFAGAVHVLYGSGTRLTGAGAQFFHQDTTEIEDTVEPNDMFGRALAAGDFNGDSRVDLAVGVPTEDIGSVGGAGAVNVIYGSTSGLATAGDQFFSQDTSGIADMAETFDVFGHVLASR